MSATFASTLSGRGYRFVQNIANDAQLYAKEQGFSAKLVLVVRDRGQETLSSTWLIAMRRYLEEQYAMRNYTQINCLLVVFTARLDMYRPSVNALTPVWFVDARQMRPIIFEGQPYDFDGLYAGLQESLASAQAAAQARAAQNYGQGYAGQNYGGGRMYSGQQRRPGFGGGNAGSFFTKEGFRDFVRHQGLCNLSIIAINILVFVFLSIIGSTLDTMFMLEHGAMFPYTVIYEHAYWQMFTSMFLHFGFSHIFNNMLVLFFLGDNLERAVGHWKYLIIYLGGGLIGNVASLAVSLMDSPSDWAVSAGASGAIFAVVGALVYIVIRNHGRLEDLSTTRLLILVGFTLYHGFTSYGVDNGAHVGGLIGGFLLAVLLYRKKKPARTGY